MKRLLISKDQIIPSDPRFEAVGVFNAGCTRYMGKTLLLLRVAERVKQVSPEYLEIPYLDCFDNKIITRKFFYSDKSFDFSDTRIIKGKGKTYLTSMSHFRVATVDGDGVNICQKPAILPESKYETNGIEDPRITNIDGTYYITYACSSDNGILSGVIQTRDFKSFSRLGYTFHPDNKDMVIFPEKVDGKYLCMHRPSTTDFGRRSMWLAESRDLTCWGNHRLLLDPRDGYFDSERVGAGGPPIKIKEGWLEIYHGANSLHEYCLGALLLDLDNPEIVLARSERPILSATLDFEKKGFFPNVVFSCGAVLHDDILSVYYGAADESVAVADIRLDSILQSLTWSAEGVSPSAGSTLCAEEIY